MFGLHADWSLDVHERYFTIGDYAGGEARWCPGCGDHGVLTALQRLCRDQQIEPERTVVVSGIGCSSRFPHYMGTYGFHGLHGRAFPVACGIKSRRPELDVWLVTGDGDCFSIGAAHWIHAIRYNMDLTVLVFDNGVYGLTKQQTSPTSPLGFRTNTHPGGAVLPAHNPLGVTLGITNVSYVAQVIDWNIPLLYRVIQDAHRHRGTGFVRIIQRCPVYADSLCQALREDPARVRLLTHESALVAEPDLLRLFPNRLEHDPRDLSAAREVAHDTSAVPVGVLYRNPDAPCYDDLTSQGREMPVEDRLSALERVLDRVAV